MVATAPPKGHYPPTHQGMVRYVADQMGVDFRWMTKAFMHARRFLESAVLEQGHRVSLMGLGTLYRQVAYRAGRAYTPTPRFVLKIQTNKLLQYRPQEENDDGEE